MTNNIEIHGLQHFSYCETRGLAKCFTALGDLIGMDGPEVMEDGIGFNADSGYVYIALEEGVTICSMLGQDVEYLVINYDDGEETFFDTYEEAVEFLTYVISIRRSVSEEDA